MSSQSNRNNVTIYDQIETMLVWFTLCRYNFKIVTVAEVNF